VYAELELVRGGHGWFNSGKNVRTTVERIEQFLRKHRVIRAGGAKPR